MKGVLPNRYTLEKHFVLVGILLCNDQIEVERISDQDSFFVPNSRSWHYELQIFWPHNLLQKPHPVLNLHQQLQEKEPVVISSIAGMGGVGKTELALQYATQYKSTYTGGICWLYAREVSVGIRIVAYAQVQLGLAG